MVNQPIGNHGLGVFWCDYMALVSFLSGGYNLHWFWDALGKVTFVSFIKQTFIY